MVKQWPHAPVHWQFTPGIYMVTASTYRRIPHLKPPARKDFFLATLSATAQEFGWELHAWAVLHEHYHFIARSPEDPTTLRRFIAKLHAVTARAFNKEDGTPGRKVWFQYWDTLITYQRSYLARLRYVNLNPVKHGLTRDPLQYPWCSARWFAENAPGGFVRVVNSLKVDKVKVFEPV